MNPTVEGKEFVPYICAFYTTENDLTTVNVFIFEKWDMDSDADKHLTYYCEGAVTAEEVYDLIPYWTVDYVWVNWR